MFVNDTKQEGGRKDRRKEEQMQILKVTAEYCTWSFLEDVWILFSSFCEADLQTQINATGVPLCITTKTF